MQLLNVTACQMGPAARQQQWRLSSDLHKQGGVGSLAAADVAHNRLCHSLVPQAVQFHVSAEVQ